MAGLRTVGSLQRCVHAGQGRAALAGAAAALGMGPKERAMYLRKRLGPEALGGPEEEASTLAGPTPGALRTWLRQVGLQTLEPQAPDLHYMKPGVWGSGLC